MTWRLPARVPEPMPAARFGVRRLGFAEASSQRLIGWTLAPHELDAGHSPPPAMRSSVPGVPRAGLEPRLASPFAHRHCACVRWPPWQREPCRGTHRLGFTAVQRASACEQCLKSPPRLRRLDVRREPWGGRGPLREDEAGFVLFGPRSARTCPPMLGPEGACVESPVRPDDDWSGCAAHGGPGPTLCSSGFALLRIPRPALAHSARAFGGARGMPRKRAASPRMPNPGFRAPSLLAAAGPLCG